jgi:hypothetical protein
MSSFVKPRLVLLPCWFALACSPAAGGGGDGPNGSSGSGGTGVAAGGGGTGGSAMGGGSNPGGGAGGNPGSAGNATGGIPNGTGGNGTGGVSTGGVGGQSQLGGNGGEFVGSGGKPPFDAGTDPYRNRVVGGQVCDRLSTIQCAGERACCDAPGRNFEQCKSAMAAECANEYYLDAITANPITGYDIDAAEAAFAEFENRASQCDPSIATWASSLDGLRGITKGTLGSGADCTGSLVNVAESAAHLAACTNAATTACLPTSTFDWTCEPRSALNGPCFLDLNCQDGLYCDNLGSTPALTGRTCLQRKANGSGCVSGLECSSLTCENGSCTEATDQTAYCLQ